MSFRARIESGSSRNESIQHGTSAQVETIECPSYQEKILKHNESLTIPFDVRSIIQTCIESGVVRVRQSQGFPGCEFYKV
jgi:hypothetical protein